MHAPFGAAAHAIPAPRPIRQGSGFRHVGFAYAGGGRVVIQNIRFTLHPDEKFTLIGDK